jgi:hypothetical protein
MLYDQLELLKELLSWHDFDLSLDLHDDVLELVIEQHHTVSIYGLA